VYLPAFVYLWPGDVVVEVALPSPKSHTTELEPVLLLVKIVVPPRHTVVAVYAAVGRALAVTATLKVPEQPSLEVTLSDTSPVPLVQITSILSGVGNAFIVPPVTFQL